MTHLSAEQLVDIAEGASHETPAHLRTCADCRRQLADLRAMMSAVADVDVPEPSPLFWDHFSSRVRDAVDVERQSPRSAAGWWSLRRPLVWMPAAAVLVLAVAIVTSLDRTARSPLPPSSGSGGTELAEAFQVPDDPSLSLVADLTADLDWDAVEEAGLTTHVGADNDAVLELTDGERRELGALLRMELAQPGRRGA